jgi:hypothetical protein
MGNDRWKSFTAHHLETDLWIAVSADTFTAAVRPFAMDRILFYRDVLERHIREYPDFLNSLVPLNGPDNLHPLVSEMYEATRSAGTGPMSAVAGAVAEYICRDLVEEFRFPEVVVENGGDLFMKLVSPVTISVFAGSSPVSDKIGLEIRPEETPLSVCCSSGTIGHSMSVGTADACVIACQSGALADAYATAFCNRVSSVGLIDELTEKALKTPEILSVVIIKDDKAGIGGRMEVKILG